MRHRNAAVLAKNSLSLLACTDAIQNNIAKHVCEYEYEPLWEAGDELHTRDSFIASIDC